MVTGWDLSCERPHEYEPSRQCGIDLMSLRIVRLTPLYLTNLILKKRVNPSMREILTPNQEPRAKTTECYSKENIDTENQGSSENACTVCKWDEQHDHRRGYEDREDLPPNGSIVRHTSETRTSLLKVFRAKDHSRYTAEAGS